MNSTLSFYNWESRSTTEGKRESKTSDFEDGFFIVGFIWLTLEALSGLSLRSRQGHHLSVRVICKHTGIEILQVDGITQGSGAQETEKNVKSTINLGFPKKQNKTNSTENKKYTY